MTPMLWVVIAFQAAQRAANFAISNPAREVLFTVVDREEKYKAKNVIDNVVFRGSDALFGWVFTALRGAFLAGPRARRSASSSAARSRVIASTVSSLRRRPVSWSSVGCSSPRQSTPSRSIMAAELR